MMRARLSLAALIASIGTLTIGNVLLAGDWPQLLGPHRNGHADKEALAESWPEAGPAKKWERPVGSGYAGLAVVDGKALLFHRLGDEEIVEAMQAETGAPLWKTSYPASYVPTYTDDNGPRCVPLVHNGKVYVFGSHGDLRAINLKDGAKLWERDTFGDYHTGRASRGEPAEGYFGFGTSPIVEDNKLILNVGGDRNQAGIVAFDLDTGKTLWSATTEKASYSSPMAATIDRKRHLIFATRFHVVSLNPADGTVRFQFPFGRPGPSATGANPLILDKHLFVTASYGFGAVFAKLQSDEVEIVWKDDDLMSSQYTTCVEQDGLLYGIHGRQDGPPADLRCFDPATKKVHWTQESFGYATLIKADGKLLILKTDGKLVLAALDSNAYRELARASILTSEARSLPALSNGLLYARDTNTLKCVAVGMPK